MITGVPADFLNLEPKQLIFGIVRQFEKSKYEISTGICNRPLCYDGMQGGSEGQSHDVLRRSKRIDWADVTDGSAVSLSTWKTDNDCNEPV